MHWLSNKIIKHKIAVLIAFVIATILSVVLAKGVVVNYDLMKYLPSNAPSTTALEIMDKAFDTAPPNLRILIKDVTIPEALDYKDKISKVPGVKEINWLDDSANLDEPIEIMDKKTLDTWYKDNNALFSAYLDSEDLKASLSVIKSIIGENGAMSGDAVNTSAAQESSGSEVNTMMLFIVPLILFILLITTSSWFEPILFLTAIGVAILINNGTNIIFDDVSFITQTSSSILQLAVSMDYSIFLLHRFAEYRAEGENVKDAMAKAMAKSFSSILASGMTTILGFAALIFMKFGLGPDMGVVLGKGIVFSLLSVMFLLPVMTVFTYKIIDKTHHRSFVPSFTGLGKLVPKLFLPVIILVTLLIVPSFLAQQHNTFLYGNAVMTGDETSDVWKDTNEIDTLYGKSNQLVLLIPSDDIGSQIELTSDLKKLPEVTSITGYTETVGSAIPMEYIPTDVLNKLVSNGYSRLIIDTNTDQESDHAFEVVTKIREISKEHYGDQYYLAGGSVNVYDMKETVTADNKVVTVISILGIGLIIMITFRSLSIPIILILAIESSIWINLSVPYFAGSGLAYIGFMIINSVQLGATVDYAILFANRYMENRRVLGKRDAISATISNTTASILTSASILSVSGIILGTISSNGVIGELGMLIGRGAALSAVMVLFFLPGLLYFGDFLIRKSTVGAGFITKKQQEAD